MRPPCWFCRHISLSAACTLSLLDCPKKNWNKCFKATSSQPNRKPWTGTHRRLELRVNLLVDGGLAVGLVAPAHLLGLWSHYGWWHRCSRHQGQGFFLSGAACWQRGWLRWQLLGIGACWGWRPGQRVVGWVSSSGGGYLGASQDGREGRLLVTLGWGPSVCVLDEVSVQFFCSFKKLGCLFSCCGYIVLYMLQVKILY